jgi:hypothetical protein
LLSGSGTAIGKASIGERMEHSRLGKPALRQVEHPSPVLFLLIVGVALLALTTAPVHFGNSTSVPAAASVRRLSPRSHAFFFEQNVGQMDRSVEFIAHGSQYDLLLSGSGMVFKPKEAAEERGNNPSMMEPLH